MKRFIALMLAVMALISFGACSSDKTNNTDTTTTIATTATTTENTDQNTKTQITPLLYKVSDENGNCVWLFGSIHVGKDYYYPLPDYVLSAYENADALAVECDIKAFESDVAAQTEALMPLVYTDGTKISDHISEEVYEKAVEAMTEFELYASYMDMFSPILWYSLIDTSLVEKAGAEPDLGIDNYFLNDAYSSGKEILEVESVKFQYDMLANFSEKLQALLLEEVLYYYENFDLYKEDIDTLMNVWADGDSEEFAEYLLSEDDELETEEEKMLYEEYNNAMIVNRNIGMADFAEDAIENGKEVFICVGAAHVVGEGAMADLLTKRGYNVEIIR